MKEKEDGDSFRPLGLVEIVELYKQRKRPPLDHDNVYAPYRDNDEPIVVSDQEYQRIEKKYQEKK